jgi:thiamine kinase
MPDPLVGLHLPGWLAGAAPVRRLANGPVSETWRLRTDGRDVVLRRDRPLARALGLDRAREARVLDIAFAGGVAPEPLLVDPEQGVVVTAWVDDAAAAAPGSGNERVSWRALGQMLRRVHALPTSGVAPLDLAAVAARYAAAAGEGAAGNALAERIAERSSSLFAGDRPVLCHNDAHAGNFVNGSRPLLLDWEYAAPGHPLFDLAAVAGFHGLDASATRALLDGWGGEDPPADPAAFPAFLELYGDVASLWARAVTTAG